MSFYHLLIEKGCSLNCKNNQLMYSSEEKELYIPIEDISVTLIESIDVNLTSKLIFKLAEKGVSLIFLDEKHTPIGELSSLNNHSRQIKSIQLQIVLTDYFKGKLWQQIIKNKIKNHHDFLSHLSIDNSLKPLINKVSTSDSENIESRAAAEYFRKIIKGGLKRRVENKENAVLNYGYAILRSKISQELSSYGFLDCLGINHKSDTNKFNLSYELIEPFRVFAEIKLIEIINSDLNYDELNTEIKQKIIKIIDYKCLINGQEYTVHTGIKRYVKSFSNCLHSNDYKLLDNIEAKFE